MKHIKLIGLIALISLIGITPVFAAATEFTSENYKLDSLNFGHPLGLVSNESSQEATISNFQVTDIALTSAVISYQTPGLTKNKFEYGTTSNYGQTIEETGFTKDHVLRLTGLTQGTTYHAKVTAQTESGTKRQSDDYVFSTNPIPAIDLVTIKDLTSSSATISVTANTDVSVQIEYYTNEPVEVLGIKPGQKQTAGSSAKAKQHDINLVGLIGNATYFYSLIIDDSFGNRTTGGETSFRTPKDTVPPKLTPLKIEKLNDTKDSSGDVKIVVTWNTDKVSTGQLAYSQGPFKGEDKATKTTENKALTTTHLVILKLKPATNYSIMGISRDRAGNVGRSAVVNIQTPKARRSAFQFALDQLISLFGAFFKAITK